MNELLLLLAGLIAVFGLVYLLYINGVGVINSKSALVYQGFPGSEKTRTASRPALRPAAGLSNG